MSTQALRTEAFDFELPAERIAQHPKLDARDRSRLLVYNRLTQSISHRSFPDHMASMHPGDLLVLNNTKVIPARLRGEKLGSKGKIELLLAEEIAPNRWLVMLKPGKRVRKDTLFELFDASGQASGVKVQVIEKTDEGRFLVAFLCDSPILQLVDELGEMPLPPYIIREQRPTELDRHRYQTVYAKNKGSVAAPTAGLHFTPALLKNIQDAGIRIAWVTLHVGLGTFTPVKAEWVADHIMHKESYDVPEATLRAIEETRQQGGKITAVGTTSLRVLESLAQDWKPGNANHDIASKTGIFIYPPFRFQLTDRLITNFHLPKSSLLMLISAFAAPGTTDGVAEMQRVYQEAISEKYQFFSYGDAMLIHS
ncbi:MAG: tRNA preQ1(34) S-adenosylmethionine ribosyltransferase-isomerase QueA [Verrucomicrobiota bacterium]|nr:tRNA preQ1(34) S-adenosylmethionine ribosyltransferase-isomerase QueA [Verrucomicrobiota bacterium]